VARPRGLSAGRLKWAVRGGLIALAAAGCASVYYLVTVPPTADTFYPRCQLHATTGLHCPGCGTTRALHALLNGRVGEALRYNALFPIVIPAVVWAFVHSIRVSKGLSEAHTSRAVTRGFTALAVAVIAYGILRNVPIEPFTLLAPREL
jgi:hypothetical protein